MIPERAPSARQNARWGANVFDTLASHIETTDISNTETDTEERAMRNVNRIDRERWKSQNRSGGLGAPGRAADVRVQKGFGPNKASGHKGGISRQGSKR